MHQLDTLQNVTHNIKVDMSGNLLSCKCDCYDFFKWMTLTDTVFIKRQTYQCEFDDGKRITLNRLSCIISKLESHCYRIEWFEIYVGNGVSINLLILICCVMYRMRHYLWYIYLKAKLNRQRLKALIDHQNFTYSAFIFFFLLRGGYYQSWKQKKLS